MQFTLLNNILILYPHLKKENLKKDQNHSMQQPKLTPHLKIMKATS